MTDQDLPIENGYFEYVPTRWQRMRKRLGFRHAVPPFDDARNDEQVFFNTMISVPPMDRLRILFRGHVHLSGIVFSATTIPHADVHVGVGVPWSAAP